MNTTWALEYIGSPSNAIPRAIPVRFAGMDLFLTRGGALAPPEHMEDDADCVRLDALFEDSYAHLFPTGEVKRYGKVVGMAADIERREL